MIIFGFGKYAKDLFCQYRIPWNEIEAIIDRETQIIEKNSLGEGLLSLGDTEAILERDEHRGMDDTIRTVPWDEFKKIKKDRKEDYIIIGTKAYQNEIRETLIESKLFSKERILDIDDWIVRFPKIRENSYERDFAQLIRNAGEINRESLADARILVNREEVLKYLPKEMGMAEVGVAYGYFSEKLLDNAHPEKLYAIDIFDDSVKGFWESRVFEEADMTHLKWYETKFRKEIGQGIIEIRRGISYECLAQFPDNYFDYIYLDAAHDYTNVKKDVEEIRRVVRPKGIVQFNDYILYDYLGKEFYGVRPAVNQLINETKSKVLYYCLSLTGFDDIVIELNK